MRSKIKTKTTSLLNCALLNYPSSIKSHSLEKLSNECHIQMMDLFNTFAVTFLTIFKRYTYYQILTYVRLMVIRSLVE